MDTHLLNRNHLFRGFNFGAGPATLPEDVLQDIQDELLNWQGMGMSILEIGHRTPEFTHLLKDTEQVLRRLLDIPESYHVLFWGGAARALFGAIPLNLLQEGEQGAYLITGIWSKMAYQEALKLKAAHCAGSGEAQNFTDLPAIDPSTFEEDCRYFYYTPNETVNGIYTPKPKFAKPWPLIADMTSCLLCETIQITDYDLILAGAQKNIANAGLSIVILSDRLLQTLPDNIIPTMLDFKTYVEHGSLYATPPVFNCYIANKVGHWVERQGGVAAMQALNQSKAKALYEYIDASGFYHCPIAKSARSNINICFNVNQEALLPVFLKQAQESQLLALQGHRAVGGLRASLYNAMPMEGVMRLLDFMQAFARKQ